MTAVCLIVALVAGLLTLAPLVGLALCFVCCAWVNRRQRREHEQRMLLWFAGDRNIPPPRPPADWVCR